MNRCSALLCLVVAAFVNASPALGQGGLELDWANALSTTDSIQTQATTVDASGNLYIVGKFDGPADFDPGAGTATLSNEGGNDAFVLKLDVDGDFEWAVAVGSSSSDEATGVAVDASGNVYVGGSFGDTADFDPGAGEVLRSPPHTPQAAFIWKLDSTGALLDVAVMGGMGICLGQDLALDASNNVYFVGRFSADADFDPGVATTQLTATASSQYFLAKYDSSLGLLWAQTSGGASDGDYRVALDASGNPHVSGEFQGSGDYDPGAGTTTLTSNGGIDLVIMKFDTSGNLTWARAMGGTGQEDMADLAVDGSGNVVTTGTFNGTVDFDPEAGTSNLTATGSVDVFIQKLDASGSLTWIRQLVGAGYEESAALRLDASGNAYLVGQILGETDFDPGIGQELKTPGPGGDRYTLSLDSAGDFEWVRVVDGPGSDFANTLSIDDSGNIYTTGLFGGETDFDLSSGTYTLDAGASGTDPYFERLQPDVNAPNADAIVASETTPTNADTFAFSIAFDEDVVNVDLSDLIITRTGVSDAGASVSGGPRDYTVEFIGVTGDGTYTVEVDTSSDIEDLAGNGIASSVTSAPLEIDNTPPTVDSISPDPAGPTNATSVDFDIAFSEVVVPNPSWTSAINAIRNGVGGLGFFGGIPGTMPTNLVPITFNSVSGDGTLEVSLKTAGEITDLAGNPLTVSPTSIVVVDNTPPEILSITPDTTNPTNAGTIVFTVEFNELTDAGIPAILTFADAIENGIGPVSVTPTFTGDGDTYVYQVTGAAGDGSITLRLGNGAAVVDLAQNAFVGDVDYEMFVDNTAPTVALSSVESGLTNANPIPIQVTLSEDSNDLDLGDFGLTNGAGAGFTGADDSYSFGVVPGADGAVEVSISAGVFSDIAGNPSAAGDTISFTYDGTSPVFSALSLSTNLAVPEETVTLMFQVSEDLAANPSVTLDGDPAAFVSSSKGGGMPVYVYAFPVPTNAYGGMVDILIEGMDLAGNMGALTDSSMLAIDAPEEPEPMPLQPAALLFILLLASVHIVRLGTATGGSRRA